MKLSKEEARDLYINYHTINTSKQMTLADVFDRLHTIQYDPLNVVGTNPDLVLQSRVDGYHQGDIQNALYQERFIVDGWDKQMSLYPSAFIPHYSRVRSYRAAISEKGLKHYFTYDVHELVDEMLKIVTEKGPIYSREIKDTKHVDYYWNATKASTVTLDYLFHLGKIGVYSRHNTQKKYDLMERVYPQIMEKDPFKTEENFIDFYLQKRIKALGLMRDRPGIHISGLLIENKKKRRESLQRLLDKNVIKQITIEGLKDQFYAPVELFEYDILLEKRLSFLAPLDNLMWDRDMIEMLFDFYYRWEVYTPSSKRQWGYYVLPMLYRSRFVGRIEFEKHRNNENLVILSVWWEKDVMITTDLKRGLKDALHRFKEYLQASGIQYPKGWTYGT